jgi:hypothetical protein
MVAARASGTAGGAAEATVKWLADENFRNAILRGVLRQAPDFNCVRAQDIPAIAGRDDLTMLRYATEQGRVVVTYDLSTMVPAMREQVRLSSRCAPIVLVELLLDRCCVEEDWAQGVLYLPLR